VCCTTQDLRICCFRLRRGKGCGGFEDPGVYDVALDPALSWEGEIVLEEFAHVVDFDVFGRGEL
jgi:hypothetical protein